VTDLLPPTSVAQTTCAFCDLVLNQTTAWLSYLAVVEANSTDTVAHTEDNMDNIRMNMEELALAVDFDTQRDRLLDQSTCRRRWGRMDGQTACRCWASSWTPLSSKPFNTTQAQL
jgi:hypothetical protein